MTLGRPNVHQWYMQHNASRFQWCLQSWRRRQNQLIVVFTTIQSVTWCTSPQHRYRPRVHLRYFKGGASASYTSPYAEGSHFVLDVTEQHTWWSAVNQLVTLSREQKKNQDVDDDNSTFHQKHQWTHRDNDTRNSYFDKTNEQTAKITEKKQKDNRARQAAAKCHKNIQFCYRPPRL